MSPATPAATAMSVARHAAVKMEPSVTTFRVPAPVLQDIGVPYVMSCALKGHMVTNVLASATARMEASATQ